MEYSAMLKLPHSSVSSSSYRRLCSCDLFIRIAVYAKHIVVLCLRRLGRGTEIGIHIPPNYITRQRNLEKASKPPIVDQCISVRQALSVGDARTEEIRSNTLLVFPHNVVRSGIHLYDARKGKAFIQTVGTIIKNENVAVWQRCGRVLACERRCAQAPHYMPALPLDFDDC